MSELRLTVVIGANGAGKTTWARKHRETLPKPFYNADSIAEGLGDANDAALQRAARKLVDERIERDLGEGNTFGFESTYSGRSRPDIVRTAKRLGYTTRAIFLGTETAAINIRRVRLLGALPAHQSALTGNLGALLLGGELVGASSPALQPPRRPRAAAAGSLPSSGSGRGAAWSVVSWTIWKAR